MKKTLLMAIIILSVFCLATAKSKKASTKSNLPQSHEAVILESSSPAEVMVRAIGYSSRGGKAAAMDQEAENDARKAAVWLILLGGSDPLLQTDAEKANFAKIQEQFFTAANLKQFIVWEADYYDSRLKIDGGKQLKIEKSFKINKSLLHDDLLKKGVLAETAAVAGALGQPTIMVIPETTGQVAPLELLKTDPNLKKGAEVIEAYLTARKFEVIVPEQQQVLQELTSAQYALQGTSEDYSYLLALSIGSDIYISYNVTIESRKLGSTTVKKGVVGCRAYETTTGRLLGTETGYSPERAATDAVLIEEAMQDAIDKVLSRVTAYWKEDLRQGVQYKIILNVSDSFNKAEAEDMLYAFADQVKKVAKTYRENVVADYTYDVLLWCDPAIHQSSSDLYRFFRQSYKDRGVLSRVSLNRKLILLNIVEE
ncbi:MAG: DUF6175 family protein [Candidatus Marinimicrobia bacterium]|nr:DUF6175 family protein [Candidatus Neomarinimicrobiota bacterium]